MANECTKNSNEECSPAKKLKSDLEAERKDNIYETDFNFSTFEIKRILQSNHVRKQVCVEGSFKGREEATIVLLEKQTFPTEDLSLKKNFFNEDTIIRKQFTNDIYGNYECFPNKEHNGLKVTMIHPATPKHIEKFQRAELHIIDETYELYQKVTLPFIESSSFSMEWIENILTHKAEMDKIIYEDNDKDIGFVIVSDIKWDGQLDTLKLLALPFQKIKSIRELNDSHLPLLKNIRDAGTAAIVKKYNISASQLRVYFHYQPSYYYLHVHFAYLMFEPPGIQVTKAHLLSTVISNIELMSDYYSKAVLPFLLSENDPLFTEYEKLGLVEKVKSTTE